MLSLSPSPIRHSIQLLLLLSQYVVWDHAQSTIFSFSPEFFQMPLSILSLLSQIGTLPLDLPWSGHVFDYTMLFLFILY